MPNFESKKALAAWAADQTMQELATHRDRLPGVKQVNKFESREAAVEAIWAATHKGKGRKAAEPGPLAVAKPGAAKPKRSAKKAVSGSGAAKKAKRAPKGKAAKATGGHKHARRDKAIGLISQNGGITLAKLAKAMGWELHTTRGFVSIQAKEYKIESLKVDGERTYRIGK